MFSFRTTPIGEQLDKALRDGRVGVFSTQNSWDVSADRYLSDLFRERGNLAVRFIPRETELTPGTNHIEFDPEQLQGLSAVVVEIQDVGSRYFNYTRDVFHLMTVLSGMEEAPALYVVDHVNPAGRVVEGTIPVVDADPWTPRVAHRHGLTLGELCHLYYNEIGARFALHIISALAGESNKVLLPWTIAPASDIPGMFTCLMYSGGALWNNTTVTPAIGTARPYEYIGAPFIKTADIPTLPSPEGVMLRPCNFTPSAGRYAGEKCLGFQIMLGPGAEYHSFLHTVLLMRCLRARYSQFEFDSLFWRKLADPVVEAYLKEEITFDVVQEHVKLEEQKWIRKAKRYTLYDDAPYRMK